jgi:16S rRNA (adenine1518-N6/adenine1519-N6)-dimethyltransferase
VPQGHTPRKRFGQHFLHDPQVVQRIARALRAPVDARVVEIGPGLGVLTRALIEHGYRLHAIELDRDLAARLSNAFPSDQLVVHQADATGFDVCSIAAPGMPLYVIGNLPYNVSTPLLFHFLSLRACIADMVFMLQKEVVDRLCAPPGGKDYGRLSVMVQAVCAVERLFTVGPGAFTPPPKVDSAVIRLTPYPQPPVLIIDEAIFARVVQAAFSQRRKTLRNTLKPLMSAEAMAALGIDANRRAETLSLAEFAALGNRLAGGD